MQSINTIELQEPEDIDHGTLRGVKPVDTADTTRSNTTVEYQVNFERRYLAESEGTR